MSLLGWFTNKLVGAGAEKSIESDLGGVSAPGLSGLFGFGGYSSKSDSDFIVTPATAMNVSVVYACVRNISEDIGRTRAYVYQKQAKGGRTLVEGTPLNKLLVRPSRWHDRFTFFQMTMVSLLLRGNAYIAVQRNGRGDPIALIPIIPDRVGLYEGEDGTWFYSVTRSGPVEQAQLAGMGHRIPERDIIHIRMMSYDGVLGLSPIAQCRNAIGLAAVAEKHQSKIMSQGARPSGVIKSPKKLNDKAYERLKTDWASMQSGVNNTGSTPILDDGMEWQQIGLDFVDAEFLASRKFSVAELCRIFRMPPHMAGDLERSTNNNIEHLSLEYRERTLMPNFERIETAFEYKFGLDDKNMYVEFDRDALSTVDTVTKFRALTLAVTGGWMKKNEARESVDLNPAEGGDELVQPMNAVSGGLPKTPETDHPGQTTNDAKEDQSA